MVVGRPRLVVVGRREAGLVLLFLLASGMVLGAARSGGFPGRLADRVSGRTVVIDPGHGGVDPGAVGEGGVLEKDIVLAIALRLAPLFRQAAVYTILTRTDDRDLADPLTRGYTARKREDIPRRVEMARRHGADVFLSLHANKVPGPQWWGAQVFYRAGHEPSRRLAGFIQEEFRRHVPDNLREPEAVDHLYVVTRLDIPAVVVEVGFLSNPQEARLLQRPSYQQTVAEAIFRGTLRYLATNGGDGGD